MDIPLLFYVVVIAFAEHRTPPTPDTESCCWQCRPAAALSGDVYNHIQMPAAAKCDILSHRMPDSSGHFMIGQWCSR
jgi:hypothetical protein